MRKIILILAFAAAVLQLQAAPRKVTFHKTGDKKWELLVDGQPFFVKGAVIYTRQAFNTMPAQYGANAVRCFDLPSGEEVKILDRLDANGLMVQVGLSFKQVRSGVYDKDEDFIEKQEKKIIAMVKKLKDHHAVLCWSIGNEILIGHNKKPNTEIYESIQRIAKEIHRIDPNHPVCLTIMQSFPEAEQNGLKNICKDLDFLTFNAYLRADGSYSIIKNLDAMGYDKPFILSEFGPCGWWKHAELGADRWSPWKCVVDYTSTEKEKYYVKCYDTVLKDPRCVGTSIFLWSNQTSWRDEVKEWYGLLDKNGYTYGAVDVAQYYWTGHYPVVRAPRIESRNDIKMNGHVVSDWVTVKPGEECTAEVKAVPAKGTTLRYHWRIIKERSCDDGGRLSEGLQGLIYEDGKPSMKFVAPYTPGPYRIFIHVYDDNNKKAAYASFIFLVEGEYDELKDLGGRA